VKNEKVMQGKLQEEEVGENKREKNNKIEKRNILVTT
jgi:hypothetical protein